MFGQKVSEEVKEFWEYMIDTYLDWKLDQWTFSNKKLWYDIWTWNSWYHLHLKWTMPRNMSEKRYISKCINKALAKQLKNSINK